MKTLENALQFFHSLRPQSNVKLLTICRAINQLNIAHIRKTRDLPKDIRPKVIGAHFRQRRSGAKRTGEA